MCEVIYSQELDRDFRIRPSRQRKGLAVQSRSEDLPIGLLSWTVNEVMTPPRQRLEAIVWYGPNYPRDDGAGRRFVSFFGHDQQGSSLV